MSANVAELSKQIYELKQELAKARKDAAPEPVEDYTFVGDDGEVRLSEMFGDKNELLLVHNMGKSCNYCTLWADGLVAMYPHLSRRCAFVLVSPDEPSVRQGHAAERGWNYPTFTDAENRFTDDMGFLHDGHVQPGVSAFHKNEDGSIVRTGSDQFGPGDDYCSVWPLFDLLHGGADGWEPH